MRPGGRAGLPAAVVLALTAIIADARAVTVSLPGTVGAPRGESATASLEISSAAGLLGTDVVITFDPAVVAIQAVSKTTLSASQTLTTNGAQPGVLRISLFGTAPLSGSGALLLISLLSIGETGGSTTLHLDSIQLNEGQIPADATDGQYCVEGRPEEARDLELAHVVAGSAETALTWGPVPFAVSYHVYRGTTTDLGDLSCLPSALVAPAAMDAAAPPPGALLVYLVTATNCSDESSLGLSSSGVERAASLSCP